MVLQRHYGPPGSILGSSPLNNKFRALKLSAFERELNFKKSHVIFGDPSWVTPWRGCSAIQIYLLQKTESKLFLHLETEYWYF